MTAGRSVGNVGRDRALLGPLIVLGDPERLFDDLADPDAGHGRRGRPREVDQLADRPLDPLQLAGGQVELFGGVGVGPARLRICTSELRAASGLPTSWAIPAASSPNAAIFSCWITRACEARRASVRSSTRRSRLRACHRQLGVQVARARSPASCSEPASDELAQVTQAMIVDVSGKLESQNDGLPEHPGQAQQAERMKRERPPGDDRPIADRAADQGQQVIPAERAVQAPYRDSTKAR